MGLGVSRCKVVSVWTVRPLWEVLFCLSAMLLLLFSGKVMSNCLWPHRLQHTRFSVLHSFREYIQTHDHWVNDAIQPSHSLLPTSPPALSLSSITVFSNESALHIQWPEYWSFSFSINLSNEYSGLISSRIDLFYFLAVQGTLKSLLQQQNLKASIFRHSAFFMVQLSYTSAKY